MEQAQRKLDEQVQHLTIEVSHLKCQLAHPPRKVNATPKIKACMAWLQGVLVEPTRSDLVKRKARENGFTPYQLNKAAHALRVQYSRKGYQGGSLWRLSTLIQD